MALFEQAERLKHLSTRQSRIRPVAIGGALVLHVFVLSSLTLLPLPDVSRNPRPTLPRVLYLNESLLAPAMPSVATTTPVETVASVESAPLGLPAVTAPSDIATRPAETTPVRAAPSAPSRPATTNPKLEPVARQLPLAMPVASVPLPEKRVEIVGSPSPAKTAGAPLPGPVVVPVGSPVSAPASSVAAVPTVREVTPEAAAPRPPVAPAGETRPPRELRRVVPTIPSMARAQKLSGTVLVRVTVKEDGSVEELRVIQSPSPLLDQAAVDAARRMTFEPALSGGKPVRGSVDVPFIFRLK